MTSCISVRTFLLIFLSLGFLFISCRRHDQHGQSARLQRQFAMADSLKQFDSHKAASIYRSILADSSNLSPDFHVKGLIGLSGIIIHKGSTDSAETLLRSAMEISLKSADTAMMANCLLALGNLKLDQGDNEKAEEKYKKGLTLAVLVHDTMLQNRLLLNLGNIQASGGDLPAAVKTFSKGILLAESQNDEKTLSVALENLGMTLAKAGETREALSYTRRSLEIKQKLNLPREYAQGLQNLGIIHRKSGNTDSALLCYRLASGILTGLHDSVNLVRVRYNTGIILKNQKKYREAETEMNSIIAFCRQHNIYDGIGLAYSGLASVYMLTGRSVQGIVAIDSAISVANWTKNRTYLPFHLETKVEILYTLGRYKEAYLALVHSRQISDSLFSIEKQKEIASIRAKSETMQKEAENGILKKEIEIQNTRLLLSWVTMAAGIIVFLSILILLKNKQTRLKHENLLAEESSKLAHQEKRAKEFELEKERIEKELKAKELEVMQLESSLKQEKIEQLELSGNLQEQKMVFDSLVHADLTRINRSILERLSPFRLKFQRKSDQDEFTKSLNDLTREAAKDPMAEFEVLFRQIHGSFYEKLLQRCPEMTKTELNICALMRLNLSTKEIARLTSLSIATIETTRYHIRKKLSLEPGDNLTIFMIAI